MRCAGRLKIKVFKKNLKLMQPNAVLKGIIYERGRMMVSETVSADVSSEEIVHKYIDMVYRLALSQTKAKEYADEVVQEVFLRYLQSKKVFESEEHCKAWLIRVTINCSKNIFSNSWFKKTVPLSEEISFETQEQSDAYFAVAELPKKYRTVIYLYYYEEMTVREIAVSLAVSEGTVKSQLHRGRELLRKKLKGGENFV